MKVERVVPGLFAFIGLCLLVVSVLLFLNTRRFINSSARATGTVVSHNTSRSSDGDISYYPVISFQTQDGRTIEFQSGAGSSSRSPAVGQTVELLYDPRNPQSAEINSFGSLWLAPLILSALGTIFFVVGILVFMAFRGSDVATESVERVKETEVERLKREGRRLVTKFDSIIKDESLEIDGRVPYKIVTQWHDRTTHSIHLFESDEIEFNPEEFIVSKEITVYVDPADMERYWMDISFLPRLSTDAEDTS
jgi:hypothetical protein